MAELKPCPFCGSTKLKIESKSTRAGWTGIDALVEKDTYSVRCNVCHARGGTAGGKVIKSLRYVYKDRMPEWATTSEAVKERAIEAWNKRTERPKGRWVLTAHEENCNYRWNVTAECSECSHSKGEVYAGLFPSFPKDLARDTILSCAEIVKLDNFCPNCGADMRGESE